MKPLLPLALLCFFSSAHALEPARPSANGGGDCPSEQAKNEAANVPPVQVGGDDALQAKPAATPNARRETLPGSGNRPRSQVRWQSVLPGMFR